MITDVKRGDVCWVSVDGSVGSEIQTGRPAVILSSDVNNAKRNTVSVAFLSSGYSLPDPLRVNVTVNREPQKVLCDQHRSVDKQRLTKYIGKLSDEDLKRVTFAMATVFCFPLPKNTQSVSSNCDSAEIQKLKVELDIMRGMYDRVLNQLVEMKVDLDVAARRGDALVESVVVENEDIHIDDSEIADSEVEDSEIDESEVEEEPAVFEGKVNINTCTAKEIADALGIHINFAYGIIGYRKLNGNYVCVEEVVNVERLPKNFLERFGDRLTVGEVQVVEEPTEEPIMVTGKVNINTCTYQELMARLGCNYTTATSITGYRRKNGNYICVEEVLDVDRVPKNFVERFGDSLTVGDDEPSDDGDTIDEASVDEEMVAESSDDGRLDINTASLRDFMRVGFDKRTAALITSTRKKFGKFRNVEDLSEIDGVSGKLMRKLADVLYVGDSKQKPYYIAG